MESLHQAIVDARLTPRQNRELEECIRGRFTVRGDRHDARFSVSRVPLVSADG